MSPVTSRPRIVGFGDAIIDRNRDTRIAYPGGNAANVAVMSKKLGADALFVGVFGNDDDGRHLASAIRSAGVDISSSVFREGPTGYSDFVVRAGERVFQEWNLGGVTSSQPFALAVDGAAWLDEADVIHSSVYSAAEKELPFLGATGAIVSFDFSSEEQFREHGYLRRVLPHVDIAIFSGGDLVEGDARRLIDTAHDRGAGMVVVSRGLEGSMASDGRELIYQSAVNLPPEHLVDTMGCGDALVCGTLVSLVSRGWRPGSSDRGMLRAALASGTRFAAQQCLMEASFGSGWNFA